MVSSAYTRMTKLFLDNLYHNPANRPHLRDLLLISCTSDIPLFTIHLFICLILPLLSLRLREHRRKTAPFLLTQNHPYRHSNASKPKHCSLFFPSVFRPSQHTMKLCYRRVCPHMRLRPHGTIFQYYGCAYTPYRLLTPMVYESITAC